jgi:predicted RecA/RadA family phage recombinase
MSGQYCENGRKAFINGGTALARYTRVKLSSGVLAAAVLADKEIGVLMERVEANQYGDVLLRTSSGTTPMIAAAPITAGATVFTAAAGKVSNTGTGAFQVGVALEAATADGDIIEVLRNSHGDTAA